ncbi:MAG: hypothetical protein GQ570_11960 [Helicobacteraceae bacterium]|nr:hypothetical protein [Helicobacteraceae bacterium]
MYATEFQTVISEPYIFIPNYENFKGHEVRVVLLDIDKKNSNLVIDKEDFFDRITKEPKNINNIKFLSRDEANER